MHVIIYFSVLMCIENLYKHKTSQQPQSDELNEPDLADEEMAYKTIKRGRVGRIASPLKKDERGWMVTKAVMG